MGAGDASGSPWKSTKELAAYAKVSEKTIYRACAEGRMRHARVSGKRSIRGTYRWCDEWLEATAAPVEVSR